MKNAFLAGAQEITPDTTGDFVAVGDWYDVQKAKEAAIAQGDAGARLYIGCGQGPTFGQIEAANENGGVSMGYVGDMSAVGPSVLASFTWNLKAVFQQMVDDVVAGKTDAQYYEVKMKDGGMDVVISPAWKDKISADGDDRSTRTSWRRSRTARSRCRTTTRAEPCRCVERSRHRGRGRSRPSASPACPSTSARVAALHDVDLVLRGG